MLVQTAFVVAACYYGWGSSLYAVPKHNLATAEKVSHTRYTRMRSVADCVVVLLRFERNPDIRAWLFEDIDRYHFVARL